MSMEIMAVPILFFCLFTTYAYILTTSVKRLLFFRTQRSNRGEEVRVKS